MPVYANSSQRRCFTFPSAAALLQHRAKLLTPPPSPRLPLFVYRLDGEDEEIAHSRLPEGPFKAYMCALMANNPFQVFECAIAKLLGEKQKPYEMFGLDLDSSPTKPQLYADFNSALSALQPRTRTSALLVGSGVIRLEEEPEEGREARARPNSCVSTCVYGRWFSVYAIPACPELLERSRRGRNLFKAIPASPDSFRNSFYHNAYRVAQYLCQRMCTVISPREYHPMALVVLSLVIALKTVCCESFNKGDMIAKYLPYLYGLQGSFLGSNSQARRPPKRTDEQDAAGEPPLAAPKVESVEQPQQASFYRTRLFLSTLHSNLPTDELAILQRLNYSVYVVTPEEYLSPELVFRVLRAVLSNQDDYRFAEVVAGVQDALGEEDKQACQATYSELMKGVVFTIEILRPTDALLLADPQLIAAFAVLEGLLLMSWYLYNGSASFVDKSRAGLYRALAASTVDPGDSERLFLAMHAGLFYFPGQTVPGVPEGIADIASSAMDACMPLADLTMDVDGYEQFLKNLFDVKMDFAVVDNEKE